MHRRILLLAAALLFALITTAQQQQMTDSLMRRMRNPVRQTSPRFFKTPEALHIGEQILLYQRVTGGWPKNIDMAIR